MELEKLRLSRPTHEIRQFARQLETLLYPGVSHHLEACDRCLFASHLGLWELSGVHIAAYRSLSRTGDPD
ncbi:MAG: hypothetical protein OEV40_23780, partial [Acidimicrobiia bacterium]|nr:hypothetical protein [Acidimicrobiia bacterium]